MCSSCDAIVHLAYTVCGETDDLEYLVELADIDDADPHVTVVAFRHDALRGGTGWF